MPSKQFQKMEEPMLDTFLKMSEFFDMLQRGNYAQEKTILGFSVDVKLKELIYQSAIQYNRKDQGPSISY